MRSSEHPSPDAGAAGSQATQEARLSMAIRRFVNVLYDAGERLAGAVGRLPESRDVHLARTYADKAVATARNFERALSYTHHDPDFGLMGVSCPLVEGPREGPPGERPAAAEDLRALRRLADWLTLGARRMPS
jgi:hypothetical protein